MVRKLQTFTDATLEAEVDITDPTLFEFDFSTAPLNAVTVPDGSTVNFKILTDFSNSFTAEALTVTSQPVFLDQVVAGFPVEIQPPVYAGAPPPYATSTLLELDGVAVTLPENNIYDVPADAAGQPLAYSEVASNNVVDGVGALIEVASSVSETVIAAEAPVALTAPVISGAQVGSTPSITPGTYSGAPTPTVLGAFTLDGAAFDPPTELQEADEGKTLAFTETASNGVSPDATQTVSEPVASGVLNPVDLFASGEGGRYSEVRPDTVFANADGTGAVAIGGVVGYNTDLSPNGNHITQASESAKPIFGQTAEGIYSMTTDGTDDYIGVTWPALLNTPVTRAFTGVQSNGRFVQDALDVNEERLQIEIANGNELIIYAKDGGGTNVSITIPNEQTNIFVIVVFNGASSRAIINGVKYDPINPGSNTQSNGLRLAADNNNPPAAFSAVEVFSDLTIDRDITLEEENGLISYFSNYANVSLP